MVCFSYDFLYNQNMKIILIILTSLIILASCGTQPTVEIPTVSPSSEKTILALGDSLTAGYGLPESDSYPSQLAVRLTGLGYNYSIKNAWVSGDTSAGLLSRMGWLLEWDIPSLVILCIGGNDAFQGKSVEDIETNIWHIIELLQAKNIPILFAGMQAPLNLGWDYGKKYEAIFPRLAKEYNLYYIPFLLEGVALKANLNQDDRIHPTKEWYTIVVDNLAKILEDKKLISK